MSYHHRMKKNLTIIAMLAVSIMLTGVVAVAQPLLEVSDAYMVIPCPTGYVDKICDGGDVNSDGYDDIVIAAPGTGSNDVGTIYFYSGNAVDPAVPLYTFVGDTWNCLNNVGNPLAGGDRIGIDIDNIGDVNGDGVPDLAACAPWVCEYNQNGTGSSTWEGRFYVIFGRGTRTETHWARIDGAALGHHAGYGRAASWAGNIDTYTGNPLTDQDEFLMSQTNAWTAGSFTKLYEGSYMDLGAQPAGEVAWPFTAIYQHNNYAWGDKLMCSYGDIDGNGGADYALSRNMNMLVYKGETGADSVKYDTFPYNHPTPYVAGPLNVNGDAYPDVLYVIRKQGDARMIVWPGKANYFSSPPAAPLFDIPPPSTNGAFPTDIAATGDFNDDGYDDFMVSQATYYGGGTQLGRVWVYSGFDGTLILTIRGDGNYANLGVVVSRAGDVNGDGADDILIGDNNSRALVYLGGPDNNANGTPDMYEAGYTATGNSVMVGLGNGWSVNFKDVTAAGVTALTNEVPCSENFGDLSVVPSGSLDCVDISTTATYSSPNGVEICHIYDEGDLTGPESGVKIMHWDGAAWVNATTSLDIGINEVCGTVSTLSPFVIAEGCCSGIRGNANADPDDKVIISDVTFLVNYLFGTPNGPAPPCIEEGNANGDPDEKVIISDVTYLVNYLFGVPNGPAPPACP